jgi:hypothetical protein
MNKILIIFIVVFVTSCSTIKYGNIKIDNDILMIYRMLEKRIYEIDKAKVVIDRELIFKKFSEHETSILINELRYYNVEIENTIINYNHNDKMESQKVVDVMTNINSKYEVSQIGFNNIRDHALVYEDDSTIDDLAHRSFLFFEKHNRKWMLKLEVIQFDDTSNNNYQLALRAFGTDLI